MSKTKTENKLIRIITYILVLLLLIGLLGGVVYLFKRSVGMYVDCNGTVITSSNDGITVTYSDTETTEFTINNSKGWGLYSVTDCTVKVVSNVNSSSKYDFEYSADDLVYKFSSTTDFTSVFSIDGNKVTVSENGTFELSFKYTSMSEILKAYVGTEVSIDGSPDIYTYPYFAIEIISPDESSTLIIPFAFSIIPVTDLTITPGAIAF